MMDAVPELPDVEAARTRLARVLRGRRLVSVRAAPDPIVFDSVSSLQVARALRGRVVRAVRRKGKHFWWELDERPWPVFHFGMTGAFLVGASGELPRSWRLDVVTDRGQRLVFTDPRRFGRIRLRRDPEKEPPLSELGPDVLDELPGPRALARTLAGRHAPIKAVLLDQTVFAGVGNWMADEVLYQAGIRPHRPASRLTAGEVRLLRARLRAIVRRAVAVAADSERFPRPWLFHHRWRRGPLAVTHRRERIVHETIGGRTAAWVPERQR